jgi:hypothetical protein
MQADRHTCKLQQNMPASVNHMQANTSMQPDRQYPCTPPMLLLAGMITARPHMQAVATAVAQQPGACFAALEAAL